MKTKRDIAQPQRSRPPGAQRQTVPVRRVKAPEVPPRAAPRTTEFLLAGAYIALDNLLKITGTAPSGGAAKAMAANGEVKVNGVVELRKTCKIRVGQLVEAAGARIRVLAAEE